MSSIQDGTIRSGISAVLALRGGEADLEPSLLDIGAVLDGLVGPDFEIIVATYAAAEGTPRLLYDLSARRPALRLRVLPATYADPATALSAGLDAGRFDLLFITSADRRFAIADLHRLLTAIEAGADVAIGYRACTDGLAGRVEGWALNAVHAVRYGRTARDVECFFKLLRRVVWTRLERRPRKGSFNVDLIVGARRLGFSVAEVGVSYGGTCQSATTGERTESGTGRCAA